MKSNYKSPSLAICLLFALAASVFAAPGDLDLTFGSGGIVITRGNNPNLLNVASAMAIQADGKIVVVGDGTLGGTNNWDFTVVRYNPDGSLDSSFGGTGIVHTRLTSDYDGASSVAIQADGKIVVAGSRFTGSGGSSFAVIRYNPNGTLDTSFNGTGIVITEVGGPRDFANAVALQTDGKIVVAGRSGSTFDFAIARYNADGSLDTTFNGTGKVITPVGAGTFFGGANSVAIQSDGKIIAAGESHNGFSAFTIVRYHPDGSLDTSFNGTGKVITSVGDSGSGARQLAIQTNGKIVVAGYSVRLPGNFITADFALVRYNPDGSLDTSFNGTGKVITSVSNTDSRAFSVAIQSDGKIVAAGYGRNNIGSDLAVLRFNPNGSLDTTFNGTGKVTTAFGGQDYAIATAIQADGKIVVAGGTDNELFDFYDFVVVRYQGGGATPAACPNPIDCAEFFVRQHYFDFLAREPEPSGLTEWLNVLQNCPGGDSDCLHEQRLTTSAAFFGSPEFQLKGYFAFRFYKVAFNRLPEYTEIAADMQSVTGQTPAEVYARKATFTNAFSQRSEFVNRFDAMSHIDYVAALLSRYGLSGITTPDPTQPDGSMKVTLTQAGLVSSLQLGMLSRAQVLRAIADSDQVFAAELNQAFVAMQYYGYLRRTPEVTGYNAWLAYLNAHPTDFREMVRGFVDSIEYRMRFGPP